MKRSGGIDVDVVALDNIGGGLTNDLTGIAVAQGDQLFFRFDTCGDPVGDISRADIHIQGDYAIYRQGQRRGPLGQQLKRN